MVSWVSRCLAGASDLLGSIDFQNELSSAVLMFTLIFFSSFFTFTTNSTEKKTQTAQTHWAYQTADRKYSTYIQQVAKNSIKT